MRDRVSRADRRHRAGGLARTRVSASAPATSSWSSSRLAEQRRADGARGPSSSPPSPIRSTCSWRTTGRSRFGAPARCRRRSGRRRSQALRAEVRRILLGYDVQHGEQTSSIELLDSPIERCIAGAAGGADAAPGQSVPLRRPRDPVQPHADTSSGRRAEPVERRPHGACTCAASRRKAPASIRASFELLQTGASALRHRFARTRRTRLTAPSCGSTRRARLGDCEIGWRRPFCTSRSGSQTASDTFDARRDAPRPARSPVAAARHRHARPSRTWPLRRAS